MKQGRMPWIFLPVLLLLFLPGCATLPKTVAVSGHEKEQVNAAFMALMDAVKGCHCCLDANVTLRFNSLFQSGTMSGYFQTKSPSFLKFIGENPFGQPLIIFTTDGKNFSYATVMEQRIYEGSTDSRKYVKYAPPGFDAAYSYYWLSGRIWLENYTFIDVSREKDSGHYWLELKSPEGLIHLILFDTEKELIYRHLLKDNNGKIQLDVRYEGYAMNHLHNAGKTCRLPGFIAIKSQKSGASIELEFRDWISHPTFPDSDFNMYPPQNFEKIIVQ